MDQSRLNFIIDALLMLGISAMAGIGFLIQYVLVPGSQRLAIYGRQVELSWLGLERHDWGFVHLLIGFTVLALLALHIFLHWKQIVALYRRLIGGPALRRAVGTLFAILCAALILSFLFVTPEVEESTGGEHGGGGRGEGATLRLRHGGGGGRADGGVKTAPPAEAR